MKVLPVLVLAGGAIGGVLFMRSRGISLSSINLPKPPQISILNSASSAGSVLGAETPVQVSHFADSLSGVGQIVRNLAGTVGVQTVQTGQTLVENVSSTPTSSAEVIDMGTVVKDISGKIESIPGNLVNQAKIEYCKQVLEQATASASKQ